MGCKQYTVVDISFLPNSADQQKVKDLVKEMAKGDDPTELEGKQLVIRATKCKKRKIRRFVDELRLQYGLQRARWAP